MSKKPPPPNPPTIASYEQAFPHNDEAEEAVCGAIVLERQAIFDVVEVLSPDMFYNADCRKIYEAALSLYDAGKAIDLITISQEIAKAGQDDVEMSIYLVEITSKISSSANILEHALYIKELYTRRQLLVKLSDTLSKAYDKTCDVGDLLDEAGKNLDDIISCVDRQDDATTIADMTVKVFEAYYERKEAAEQGLSAGIPTGITKLDEALGGWIKSSMNVLAARPGVGKTAMMLHFARTAAYHGYHTVIFSLEMSKIELSNRIMVGMADIDADRFKHGKLYPEEIIKMQEASRAMSQLPITIIDTPALSLRKIKNASSRLRRQGRCDIVFIDYLQLIDMRNSNHSYNRENEVSATAQEVKNLAKYLDIPVVVLSQLNRDVEKRAAVGGIKRPMLADLRESGAIEQATDNVIFICRPDGEERRGELIVAKNRNGRQGIIDFTYNESLTRIYDQNYNNYPPHTAADVPPF